MTNAEKFEQLFGITATELWCLSEKSFLKWLNAEESILDGEEVLNLLKDVEDEHTDYISRQDAIDSLKGLPTWWADEGGYCSGAQPPMKALLHPGDAISAIENLPPADVVEAVRCEDCRHNESCSQCISRFGIQKDICFCEYGER